jgi:hypothetical protein
VNFCLRGSDVPADIPGRGELYGGEDDWLARGNSAIVGPDGDVLAGQLVEEEGIVYAEIDVDRARASRRQFDPVGHYARPDVFCIEIDRTPRRAAVFREPEEPEPVQSVLSSGDEQPPAGKLTEQPGPDSIVMRTFQQEARIGVCETNSVCSSGSSRRNSLRRSSPASRSSVQSGAPP